MPFHASKNQCLVICQHRPSLLTIYCCIHKYTIIQLHIIYDNIYVNNMFELNWSIVNYAFKASKSKLDNFIYSIWKIVKSQQFYYRRKVVQVNKLVVDGYLFQCMPLRALPHLQGIFWDILFESILIDKLWYECYNTTVLCSV